MSYERQSISTSVGAALLAGVMALGGCVVYAQPRGVVVGYYGRHREGVYVTAPAVVMAPPPVAVHPVDAELQQLVAPIALYPDPLLAQLLPAASYPAQIQAVAQWLRGNPQPTEEAINVQAWDPSIKALAHYPTVVQYMNDNLGWTESLGSAFVSNQGGVMEAIQDLRAQATAVGNLKTTPQQVVVQEGQVIAVEPADVNMMYVPVYDPAVVYFEPAAINFGVGFGCGVWLGFNFDWYGNCVYFGGWHDWHREWNHGPYGWHHDVHFVRGGIHAWSHDRRFGEAPHVEHFAYPHGFHGEAFHSVPYRGGRAGAGPGAGEHGGGEHGGGEHGGGEHGGGEHGR